MRSPHSRSVSEENSRPNSRLHLSLYFIAIVMSGAGFCEKKTPRRENPASFRRRRRQPSPPPAWIVNSGRRERLLSKISKRFEDCEVERVSVGKQNASPCTRNREWQIERNDSRRACREKHGARTTRDGFRGMVYGGALPRDGCGARSFFRRFPWTGSAYRKNEQSVFLIAKHGLRVGGGWRWECASGVACSAERTRTKQLTPTADKFIRVGSIVVSTCFVSLPPLGNHLIIVRRLPLNERRRSNVASGGGNWNWNYKQAPTRDTLV